MICKVSEKIKSMNKSSLNIISFLILFAGGVIGIYKGFTSSFYLLIAIAFTVVLISVWLIFRYIQLSNRKLAYFFNSLSNEDYTLRFLENEGLAEERIFNQSLNRLKTIIQNTRLEVQQKEKYYEQILSNINTGVIALNEKGFVIQCNQFALKLLGLKNFTHTNQLRKVSSQLQETFKEIHPGKNQKVSYTNERGKVQLLINATEITIQGKKIILLVMNDIEKEMDEKEIESWIRLIRVLSHEIMNSIAPITSLSDTLLQLHQNPKDTSDPDQIRGNTINGLQAINETGKSLISFVESYRKFTRIPEPVKEFIDLNEFIHRMIILCSMEPYFEHMSIQVDIQPKNLKIYADPNLLGQVVLNIIKNAIQAMKDQEDCHIYIKAEQGAFNNVALKISDNGPGIPPEILNEIFIPFFTTKAEGSGIGLSIARQIMRAHNGKIKVDSVIGQGTTFTLSL